MDKARGDTLTTLENELKKNYETAKSLALAAKEKGDKQTAMQQLNLTKQVKADLEILIKAKSNPSIRIPKYPQWYRHTC